MGASTRQAYLDALGVVAYRARRPLAGAKASLPLAPARVSRLIPPAPAAPKIVVEDISQQPPSPRIAASTPTRTVGKSARYRLQVAGNTHLLVIAEMPSAEPMRGMAERLVANILWAVVQQEPYRQSFHWPLDANLHPELDQGAEAARDTLEAVIQRLRQSQPVVGLLVLGEDAQDCLAITASDTQWQSLPVIAAMAPEALLDSVAAKRQLWLDIKTLLARGTH